MNETLIYPVPCPGYIQPLEKDLEYLSKNEVKNIFCLMQSNEYFNLFGKPLLILKDTEEAMGMKFHHYPISDHGVPSLQEALRCVDDIIKCMNQGNVAVHCLAGIGRTGTIMACVLIKKEYSPAKAIQTVRSVIPYALENESQENFVEEFYKFIQ